MSTVLCLSWKIPPPGSGKGHRVAMVVDVTVRQPVAVVIAPGCPIRLAGVSTPDGGDVGELNVCGCLLLPQPPVHR